ERRHTIATPAAAHEDDARFVSDGEKGVCPRLEQNPSPAPAFRNVPRGGHPPAMAGLTPANDGSCLDVRTGVRPLALPFAALALPATAGATVRAAALPADTASASTSCESLRLRPGEKSRRSRSATSRGS